MFYNYPPGESNVFGGAFLDTFASAAELLKGLKEAGYDTEECSGEELSGAVCHRRTPSFISEPTGRWNFFLERRMA